MTYSISDLSASFSLRRTSLISSAGATNHVKHRALGITFIRRRDHQARRHITLKTPIERLMSFKDITSIAFGPHTHKHTPLRGERCTFAKPWRSNTRVYSSTVERGMERDQRMMSRPHIQESNTTSGKPRQLQPTRTKRVLETNIEVNHDDIHIGYRIWKDAGEECTVYPSETFKGHRWEMRATVLDLHARSNDSARRTRPLPGVRHPLQWFSLHQKQNVRTSGPKAMRIPGVGPRAKESTVGQRRIGRSRKGDDCLLELNVSDETSIIELRIL